VLLRLLLVVAGLGLLVAGLVWRQLPRAGEPRIEAALELVGIHDGRQSYAWVLHTRSGALLVDTGGDADGKRLLQELAARKLEPKDVHTVLLTHGHPDHWAAAHLFPQARVLVGPGELAVMKGEHRLKSPVGRLLGSGLMKRPPLPAKLEELQDGQVLELDGEQLRVLHVPGHTPGSVMYLWRDILFTGDSLVGGPKGVALAPSFFSEDVGGNRQSLKRLVDEPFTRIADGHTGLTPNARLRLRALLK
jgi:glyoxylase-like metal-dependent hydrolase (beta-lactamase superfamily II)